MTDPKLGMVRCLEISSTYRNRVLYPSPTSFEVNIGNGRIPTNHIAQDPVLLGAPLFTFSGNVVTHADVFAGGVGDAPVLGLSASSIDGFYNGAILKDLTSNETSIITSYNGYTKTAVLLNPFTNFTVGPYSITDASDPSHIYFPQGKSYIGPIGSIYLTDKSSSETRKIINFDNITKIIELETPFSGAWNISHTYEITNGIKISQGITTSFPTGPNSVDLAAGEPAIDGAYTGNYIRFIGGPLNNQYRLITQYIGATKTVVFNPSIVPSIFIPQTYQILKLQRDNVSDISYPLKIKGDVPVSLLDISIPLAELSTGTTILDYPFLYIRITDKNNDVVNAISSNNPNSARAIFKCCINTNTENRKFVTLKSDMVQILRFSTAIVFEILLPDGSPLTFRDAEWYSPNFPNPEIQVACTVACCINRC
jgi:hypothetical protein